MKSEYEFLVVGGGIAGAATACHLARLKYEVGLLERSHQPHHKVCGEFLSSEALDYLKEIGIVLHPENPVINYFTLSSPYSKATFKLPSPGRGISRYHLDEEILEKAQHAGVNLWRGVSMTNYRKQEGVLHVTTNQGDFYAKHLVIATGKYDHSPEHKRHGIEENYLAFKTNVYPVSGRPNDTIELFTFPGGYGGICPTPQGDNFCFILNKQLFKSLHMKFDELLQFLCASNRHLSMVLKEAKCTGPLCAIGHIPYGFVRHQQKDSGVFYVGDQGAVIPSLTGDGMAMALSSARNCAYGWEDQHTPHQMKWAMAAHAILTSSCLTELGIRIGRLNPLLLRLLFRKTRTSMKDDAHHEFSAFSHNYTWH